MTPRKHGQEPLTVERIVDAALELIDETGLEGHTMRELGARLGVDAASIYYHVPSQAALFDLIVDRVIEGTGNVDVTDAGNAEEAFVAVGASWLASLLEHPRVVPMIAVRPLRGPGALARVDALLGTLHDMGIPPRDALAITEAFGWYVLGAAQARAAQLAGSSYVEGTSDEQVIALAPEEYPNIARVVAEGPYLGFETEFDRGIRGVVSGLLAPWM